MNKVGAVIEFADGVSKEEAEKALKELVDKGLIDVEGNVEKKVHVHEYEPEWGGPVWYIP